MRIHAIGLSLVLVASVALAGCAKPDPQKAGTTVEMKNFMYDPMNITVSKGTKVTWINRDSAPHTVTSESNAGPLDSPMIQAGQSWSYTFNEAGTFTYYCKPHAATMKGASVTVTA